MQTEELTGFAKVLADWTKAVTRLNAFADDYTPAEGQRHVAVLFDIVNDLTVATATFEQLMGVDNPVLPEAGRVLFCAAPQLGVIIGRTVGNGDAMWDVKLVSGTIIRVPGDFIGGSDVAMQAWREKAGPVRLKLSDVSPDGKR
jgi:hypothetical protein